MTDTLTGELFARMIRGGATELNSSRKEVNDLNVFPIPDGDTGDNMYMTIKAGSDAVGNPKSVGDAAKAASEGMLLGARGNSGVILSRFFAGIAKGLDGLDESDTGTLVKALQMGTKESYESVSTPVEGTILTVMREATSLLAEKRHDSLEECFEILLGQMQASLERTPDLLPVLREAGVVDSGGAGLLYIFQGMRNALLGKEVGPEDGTTRQEKIEVDLNSFTSESELTFGYCTEFLLRLQSAKVDVDHFDENALVGWLCKVGESVVAFRDGSIVKVHVHTKTPGEILNHCQQYGEFLTVKIENMTLQHHAATAQNNRPKARKAIGTVAVAAGKGIEDSFREAGADVVISGGQTMNPSVQSFLEAFDKVNAQNVFVFPNNSNVVMAAQQAASLYKDSKIIVIPSKTMAEGYIALASLDFSCKDTGQIETTLREAVAGVTTGQISNAIRESDQDGIAVHEGDYVGFSGGHILTAGRTEKETLLALCESLGAAGHEVAVIFKGDEAREAEDALQALQKACPTTEFIIKDGGQPVFQYIIALC